MAIAADGFAVSATNNHTTVHLSGSLTTAATNDVILLQLYGRSDDATSPTISSITGGGLTWLLRNRHATAQGSDKVNFETWYAIAAVAVTGMVATVNLDRACGRVCSVIHGLSGADTASPFDANGSLPSYVDETAGSASTTHTVTFSTSSPTTMLVSALGNDNGVFDGTDPTDTGWTFVGGTISNNLSIGVEIKRVTSAQTGATQNFADSANISRWTAVVDAVNEVSSGPSGTSSMTLPGYLGGRTLTVDATDITVDSTLYTADQTLREMLIGTTPEFVGSSSMTFTTMSQVLSGIVANPVTASSSQFFSGIIIAATGEERFIGTSAMNLPGHLTMSEVGEERFIGTIGMTLQGHLISQVSGSPLNPPGNQSYYSWWFLGP